MNPTKIQAKPNIEPFHYKANTKEATPLIHSHKSGDTYHLHEKLVGYGYWKQEPNR